MEDTQQDASQLVKARDLTFQLCDKQMAVELTRRWHSRLPNVQKGPWQYAFSAEYKGQVYAVALWNNPSARMLPSHWAELRRLARAPGVPKNTCSRFMGWMVRWFRENHPERERCISYQDLEVHTGTIYKACGWYVAYISKPRIRDRSKNRVGTERKYRTNINGVKKDAVGKARWEILL